MKMIKKFFIAFYRLSRLNVILHDYFPFLTIVTIIGIGFKISIFDYFLAILVSLSVHCYSFIVNDLEDAEDDAMDEKKAKRNPVSSGFITYRQGLMILQLTSIPALILVFVFQGIPAFLVVLSAIVAGHLYSWKKVRYKSYPFVDLISHAYALGAFQVLYFMLLKNADTGLTPILVLIGVALISMGGALFNQVRDFQVDVKSHLRNTAITIGKNNANFFSIAFYSVGVSLVAVAAILRLSRLS
ncbi:MAG: UbiA family prenyltransferase [Candidatus Dojkabacteria bacterium]